MSKSINIATAEAHHPNLTGNIRQWIGLSDEKRTSHYAYIAKARTVLAKVLASAGTPAVEGQNGVVCYRSGAVLCKTTAELERRIGLPTTDKDRISNKTNSSGSFACGATGAAYKALSADEKKHWRTLIRTANCEWIARMLGHKKGTAATAPAPVVAVPQEGTFDPGSLGTVAECDAMLEALAEREALEGSEGRYDAAKTTQAQREETRERRDHLKALANKPQPTTERSDLEAALEAAKGRSDWEACGTIQAELDALSVPMDSGFATEGAVALPLEAFLAMVQNAPDAIDGVVIAGQSFVIAS